MGNRMKDRRKSLKYTQEQFAEVIGISASSYTRIENAFQKPSLDTLIRIARHLDLSLDYLVFGAENGRFNEVLDTDTLNALIKSADSDKLLHASKILARIAKVKGV
jgi:transcriptional regulator with XRE-family HTH domain